ncbi:MAG: hypothetical protein CSA42_00280 [Gammaproteobacteria bacterium]|nr:MAG: hypothetical protein CSA42_00280 [Gammaproteobacteria bacterium]
MDNLIAYACAVFMGFFAIMNPIANTPVFLGLAGDESREDKLKIAKTASIIAFLIVVSFIISGKYIFDLFGITIPAFKITGGILIFYVGFEMLMSKKSAVHSQHSDKTGNVAISPLAIPILAGPGTIVTAMNYVTNATLTHVFIVIVVFAVMIFLTYLAFSLSDFIIKYLGHNLITVLGKLMGLILAIIGTGMVIDGIKLAFKLS